MTRRRPGSWPLAALLAAGCAVAPLRGDVPAHGLLAAEAKATDGAGRRRAHTRLPQVLLLEDRAVRAIDPRTARELWVQRVPVNGHGVVTSTLVVVPMRGHRLVALDRRNGEVVWQTELPGEVVVGLAADDRFAVVCVAGRRYRFERRDFGRVLLVDLEDGVVRWSRRSRARLGVPAIRGKRVFVPVGTSVVALGVATGREHARAGMPVVPRRVEVARGTVVAGSGRTWVDLEAAHHRPIRIFGEDVPVLADDGGVDPGPSDAERLTWWVRVSEDGSSPREGVLLARGAVVAVRFDAEGRPDVVHWIHNARDRLEYVGIHVGRRRVVLVREDGGIVQLDTADGAVVDAIRGGPRVFGALFADLDDDDRPVRLSRPKPAQVAAAARALLARDDPRLWPAQALVLRTLARSPRPEQRRLVQEVAAGRVVRPGSQAGASLRALALDLAARPWGAAGAQARRRVLAALSAIADPSGPAGIDHDAVVPLVRQAVAAGDPTLVTALSRLLEVPQLGPDTVAEVARALRELDRPEAVPAAAAFVRRYHADPRVVLESRAMEHLVALLAAQAERGVGEARAALDEVAADPLTDRTVAAYIARHRPRQVAAAAPIHE